MGRVENTESCPKCGKSFPRNGHLRRHMQTVHSDEKPFECTHPNCGKRFSRKDLRDQHLTFHDPSSRKFPCDRPNCNMRFHNKSHLKRHYLTHDKPKPYACDHCDAAFTKRRRLLSHRVEHTGLLPFSCNEEGCDKRFSVLSDLKQHRDSAHKAIFCPMEECVNLPPFEKFSLYAKHKRTKHPEEKKFFTCVHCGRTFQTMTSYKRHNATHESPAVDRLLYKCRYPGCGASYTTSSNLGTHIRSKHTMVDAFLCEFCDASFSLKSSLKRHLHKVHGPPARENWTIDDEEQAFKCEHCDWTGKHQSSLRRHQRIAHDNLYLQPKKNELAEKIERWVREEAQSNPAESEKTVAIPTLPVVSNEVTADCEDLPNENAMREAPPMEVEPRIVERIEAQPSPLSTKPLVGEDCTNEQEAQHELLELQNERSIVQPMELSEPRTQPEINNQPAATKKRSRTTTQAEYEVLMPFNAWTPIESCYPRQYLNDSIISTPRYTNREEDISNADLSRGMRCSVVSELFGSVPSYMASASSWIEPESVEEVSESCFQVGTAT